MSLVYKTLVYLWSDMRGSQIDILLQKCFPEQDWVTVLVSEDVRYIVLSNKYTCYNTEY